MATTPPTYQQALQYANNQRMAGAQGYDPFSYADWAASGGTVDGGLAGPLGSPVPWLQQWLGSTGPTSIPYTGMMGTDTAQPWTYGKDLSPAPDQSAQPVVAGLNAAAGSTGSQQATSDASATPTTNTTPPEMARVELSREARWRGKPPASNNAALDGLKSAAAAWKAPLY